MQTTPVPNVVFDVFMRDFKIAEIKVLLVIIRQTLGWKKGRDWISASQLKRKTGCSQRSIVSAIQTLTQQHFIEVLNERGDFLNTPEKRKGKKQFFYRLSSRLISPVENNEQGCGKRGNNSHTCANFAPDLRKNITSLAQNMRITNNISY